MFFFVIKSAENGGYAVGAFNVYNLEGVDAVVSAAEEEQSPAILQVRSTLQAQRVLEWGDLLNIKPFLCFHVPT